MSASDADGVLPLHPPGVARVAIGVDTVEIARVAAVIERHGERFLNRVFTADERAYAGGRTLSLAGRFAAKEAAAKAMGTGIGPVGWRNIEIRNDVAGKPSLLLYGAAATRARTAGLLEWHVSITHSRDLATAFVVGYCPDAAVADETANNERGE
ncbi:MAG: holo-ACP synthase [Thermomicrobiales bacterium]